jgi:hypothetical protein
MLRSVWQFFKDCLEALVADDEQERRKYEKEQADRRQRWHNYLSSRPP